MLDNQLDAEARPQTDWLFRSTRMLPASSWIMCGLLILWWFTLRQFFEKPWFDVPQKA